MNRTVSELIIVASAVLCSSCAPVAISHIGPNMSSRPKDCDVEILAPGEEPARPYRDVGMVSLKNCQDYQTLPCREWLRKAACEIGGQVAYFTERGRTNEQFGPVTYKVLVGVYVADLRYDPKTDPLYRSRFCDPACGDHEKCVEGECRPKGDSDCADETSSQNQKSGSAVERCLE